MLPPEKPYGIDYFIDRQNYARGFKHLIKSKNVIRVIGDTLATYGSGKTTILANLYHEIYAEQDLNPIWISMDRFSMLRLNPDLTTESKDKVEVLAQDVVSYYQLLCDLSEAVFKSLKDQHNARLLSIGLMELKTLEAVPVDLEGDIDQWQSALNFVAGAAIVKTPKIRQTEFRRAVLNAVDGMTSYFLQEFNAMHHERRNVIFADDFCWMSKQPIGDWVLNKLTIDIDNMVMIVAHTDQTDLMETKTLQQSLRLSNFTPEEVGQYLEKRLTTADEHGEDVLRAYPDLVEDVYHFTKGHSQTVCLVADLLKYVGIGRSKVLLERTEVDVANEPTSERLARIVKAAVTNLTRQTDPAWLRDALRLGAVLRRYDGHLMLKLLLNSAAYREEYDRLKQTALREAYIEKDEDAKKALLTFDAKQAQEISKTLERYSFVDYYQDEAGPYYAFHHFVAEQIIEMIAETSAQEFNDLHKLVANHYSDVISRYDKQDDETLQFVSLHLYEDTHWQVVVTEWLYHSLMLQGDEKQAQLEFARVYMQAFQWWGSYIKFPFCDRLLTQLESMQLNPDEAGVIGWLRQFHTIYPLGSPRQKIGASGWQEARAIIEKLMSYFDLVDYERLSLHRKLNEGETNLLLNLLELYAACFRFVRPEANFERAEAIYQMIPTLSIAKDDEEDNQFHLSYGRAYLAEMYMEQGRYAEAEKLVSQALEALTVETCPVNNDADYEVFSLCHRIIGEVALINGDYALAAQHFLDASQFVFVYNFSQLPVPPDPYTARWNKDMNLDISAALIRAWQQTQSIDVVGLAQHLYLSRQAYNRYFRYAPEFINIPELLEQGDADALSTKLLMPVPDLVSKHAADREDRLEEMLSFCNKLLATSQE